MMMKLLADENFDGRIVRALRRRQPDIDLVRAQDVDLSGSSDPEVLEWASEAGRMVLTHDVNTMIGFATQRISNQQPMPGLIAVPLHVSLSVVIDDLLLFVRASQPAEWNGKIVYLPL